MHVTIPPALAADLVLLTDALDHPTADIGATIAALASDAATAVPSYVGLSVRIQLDDDVAELTTLDEESRIRGVATSLRIPVGSEPSSVDGVGLMLVLYASAPGAFVDLAADLAWLTGRPLADMRLDDDLAGLFLRPARSLRARSTIDQALGVLIDQGLTPEHARAQLAGRAAEAGSQLASAALALLASIPSPSRDETDGYLPGR
jgi:hypothetical protein